MPIPSSPITPFLEQQGFLLLDGGLATELEKHGHDLNNKMWSASVLIDKPNAIHDVHLSYLVAGADCIITATYQASVTGFMNAGMSKNDAESVIRKAIAIAVDARAQYLENNEARPTGMQPLIAASIGPYGAYLADGSEFRGKYAASAREIRAFHEPRWNILADSPAELFAIETIPSYQEAVVFRELLESTPDVRAWISFSCKDETNINDGTPLVECTKLFNDCVQIVAVGVNCTAPRYISSLIEEAREGAPGIPVVVYPNSGEIYDEHQRCWTDSADQVVLENAATEWFTLGARLIGGCCRTNPDQIARMKTALNALQNG